MLFGFRNMAEYEYENYSGPEIWPNTNTDIMRNCNKKNDTSIRGGDSRAAIDP